MNQKDGYLPLKATGSEDLFVSDSSALGASAESSTHRHFALQPIFTAKRKALGYETLYRAGWEDAFRGDLNHASRAMIDNWLLYGYEDFTSGRFTFLNCTREILLSGLLPLLPKWAVFEILETVEPDPEVLKACRSLKRLGYRISLDDFDDPARMTPFLNIADFIKIDFRLSNRLQRVRLANGLKSYGATLIAEKIETEEEFRTARWEGFELFQGFYFAERGLFAMCKDALTIEDLEPIRESLRQPGFALLKYAEWLDQHPGVGCRILRRANWLTPSRSPVNSTWEALKLIGKNEFRKIVGLALLTLSPELSKLPLAQALPDIFDDDFRPGNGGTKSPDNDSLSIRRGRDGHGGKLLTMSSVRRRTNMMRPIRCG